MKTVDISNPVFLSAIQCGFPVTERPFLSLGKTLRISEEEMLNTIRSLQSEKIIRAFGPVFDPQRLGYVSTLAAVEIDGDTISGLVKFLQNIPQVTHVYLRNHKLNLWFTITARSKDILEGILSQVGSHHGVYSILNLPVRTVYKINAVFGVPHEKPPHLLKGNIQIRSFSEMERNIVKALQRYFPIVERPYSSIGSVVGLHELDVISIVSGWIQDGTIRRFGARLNHNKLGYVVNILAAWKGDSIDNWGQQFAGLTIVSHCYRRESSPEWPYELYTMIHAKTDDDMEWNITTMKTIAEGAEMVALKTIRELKKTTMIYFMEE